LKTFLQLIKIGGSFSLNRKNSYITETIVIHLVTVDVPMSPFIGNRKTEEEHE